MSIWSWFNGIFDPSERANQKNIAANKKLAAYVEAMRVEFRDRGVTANISIAPIPEWSESGRITPPNEATVTLVEYPGFMAKLGVGFPDLGREADNWARQLLRNAKTKQKEYYPPYMP